MIGWRFVTDAETPGCIPDFVNGAAYLKEVYLKANADFDGDVTVPVLWDKKQSTIVNTESAEILRMLNSEFNAFAKNPSLDLYPEHLRSKIDEINGWVAPEINGAVYKVGFAKEQAECRFPNLQFVDKMRRREALP